MKSKSVFVLLRRFALGALLCLICGSLALADESYRVVHSYPHDPNAFTQGLIYLDGYLYESTGLYGQSTLRKVDLKTGKVLQEIHLPSQYFGEGLTNWGNTLVQLTWKAHLGFVYNLKTFKRIRTFHYPWQGWGLTQNSHQLILSDGSATLHFLNPETFKQVRSIHVTRHGTPVKMLNELEYIHGEIYANIWLTNEIVCISPQTGKVLHTIDLAGLLPHFFIRRQGETLNGIAFDAAHNRLFVTGKLWPRLFQIQVIPDAGGK